MIPDDIKVLAEPALAHRVIIKTSSSIHDVSAAHVVRELLDSTPIEAARQAGGPREVTPEPGRADPRTTDPHRQAPETDVPPTPARRPRRRPRGRRVLDRATRSCSSSSTSACSSAAGSYILTRLGLSDLEAGYAVSQLSGHVGDRLRITYTLRNTGPAAQAVARGPQPDDAARRAARPRASRCAAGRSARGSSGPASSVAATTGSSRSRSGPGDPFGFFEASAAVGQGVTLVVYPRVDALPLWKLPPASIEGAHAQAERTLQTTPLATTVRPYAPGDSMNRIHWRTTARPGEIQVKEFDLEQTADAWIFLDLDAAAELGSGDDLDDRGRGARRRVRRRQGAGREPRGRAHGQRPPDDGAARPTAAPASG